VSIGRNPVAFAALAVAFYVALIFPMAASRDFDTSAFVLAGDVYVDHAKLEAPLKTVTHSFGYDGQFFYRLARRPFSVEPQVEGVTLDAPAKRMQRILYPLMSWFVSLGRADWAPASLVVVNLAAMAVVAASAAWLTRRRELAWWFPFAIAGWPGFLIALTHDTAEIVSAGFCLVAIAFYMSDRLPAYFAAVVAATLTRETVIPIFLGPLIYESWAAAKAPSSGRLGRAAICALAFAPFAAWHEIVGALWGQVAQPLTGNADLGWPLVGVADMLIGQINGGWDGEAGTTATLSHRVFVAVTALGLIGFCIGVALRLRLPGVNRSVPGLAIGWCLDLVLMSLLTAAGPWVGPQAYFRAFTECWIVGCLLLALAPAQPAMGGRWRLFATLAAADVVLLVWKLCLAVLPT